LTTVHRIGEVAEWSNVPDSKSGVPQGTVGSNPTLSANAKPQVIDLLGVFFILSPMIWVIPTKVPTTAEVIG
jgi:hypothetical protein